MVSGLRFASDADSKTLQIQGLTLADNVTFTVWPQSHMNLSQQQVGNLGLLLSQRAWSMGWS